MLNNAKSHWQSLTLLIHMQLICPINSRKESKPFLICLLSSKEEEMFREFVFIVILPRKEKLQEEDLVI